jgi:hypothetical protein
MVAHSVSCAKCLIAWHFVCLQRLGGRTSTRGSMCSMIRGPMCSGTAPVTSAIFLNILRLWLQQPSGETALAGVMWTMISGQMCSGDYTPGSGFLYLGDFFYLLLLLCVASFQDCVRCCSSLGHVLLVFLQGNGEVRQRARASGEDRQQARRPRVSRVHAGVSPPGQAALAGVPGKPSGPLNIAWMCHSIEWTSQGFALESVWHLDTD